MILVCLSSTAPSPGPNDTNLEPNDNVSNNPADISPTSRTNSRNELTTQAIIGIISATTLTVVIVIFVGIVAIVVCVKYKKKKKTTAQEEVYLDHPEDVHYDYPDNVHYDYPERVHYDHPEGVHYDYPHKVYPLSQAGPATQQMCNETANDMSENPAYHSIRNGQSIEEANSLQMVHNVAYSTLTSSIEEANSLQMVDNVAYSTSRQPRI